MRRSFSVLIFLIGVSAMAQSKEAAATFVRDHSKPYAFLKFDHIGPSKTLQGEGNAALWLRVVNNCQIPLVFAGNSLTDEPGFLIGDEVVDDEPGMQILSSREQEREVKEHERLRKLKHKPNGFSFEVSGVVKVLPGKEILFVVPLNHVDDDWHLNVKFALETSDSSVAVGPFTYLPFYKWDIPKTLH